MEFVNIFDQQVKVINEIDENGQPISISSYLEGKPHGTWVSIKHQDPDIVFHYKMFINGELVASRTSINDQPGDFVGTLPPDYWVQEQLVRDNFTIYGGATMKDLRKIFGVKIFEIYPKVKPFLKERKPCTVIQTESGLDVA